jgi:glutamine amidotransferase
MTVGIIDYGSGNIFSVSNALNKINIQNKIISNPSEIKNFSTILLPGVGNFKSCITKFKKKNFLNYTLEHVSKGKKLLGICVGMQMLFDYSEEDGKTEGMSLLNGNVTLLNPNQNNFENKFRLPNMGWSSIRIKDNSIGNTFFQNIDKLDYYFAHSYTCRLKNKSYEVATNSYGVEECLSVVANNNIIGIQFHPEKSGESGLKLLKNILVNY